MDNAQPYKKQTNSIDSPQSLHSHPKGESQPKQNLSDREQKEKTVTIPLDAFLEMKRLLLEIQATAKKLGGDI